MEQKLYAVSTHQDARPTVHCWDTQSRKIMCGQPGQTGSTKHHRDVTCPACREVLGLEARDGTPAAL